MAADDVDGRSRMDVGKEADSSLAPTLPEDASVVLMTYGQAAFVSDGGGEPLVELEGPPAEQRGLPPVVWALIVGAGAGTDATLNRPEPRASLSMMGVDEQQTLTDR